MNTKRILYGVVLVVLVVVLFKFFDQGKLNQQEVNVRTGTPAVLDRGVFERTLADWPDRPYRVSLPSSVRETEHLPVIIALHGGGLGNAEAMQRLTCPKGAYGEDGCLDSLGEREGFITVYPNGTPDPDNPTLRTWNGGGGKDGFTCFSGYACEQDIDDVEYITDVLDNLYQMVAYDKNRVYVIGFSNGAALTHKLGCILSDRIAAIAPLANGNQYSTTENCNPVHPMPVIEFHSVDDPFNPYDGGFKRTFGSSGKTISIEQTVADWAERNNCKNESDYMSLSNSTVEVKRYTQCEASADVLVYRMHDVGHTWPNGWQYLNKLLVGSTERTISANEMIWDFVSQFSRN